MSPFARTLRALEVSAQGGRARAVAIGIVVVLLGAWGTWLFAAPIDVHATTDRARLEVVREPHRVQANVRGRVSRTRMEVGDEVQAGDVLVALDDTRVRLEIAEARAREAGLEREIEALERELDALGDLVSSEARADQADRERVRSLRRAAAARAELAETEAERVTELLERGAAAQMEEERVRGEAVELGAVAEAQAADLSALPWRQRTRLAEREAAENRIRRDLATAETELATTRVAIQRLEADLEDCLIRAPIDGRLGEVEPVQVGAVIEESAVLGTVIPSGDVRIAALFPPAEALGRIRPGQGARMHLRGFPSTQFGHVPATVDRVSSEPRDGFIRVELAVPTDAEVWAPLEHGLPGTVEVVLEKATPAELVLRATGHWLAGRAGSDS